ncbi:MAG: CGNR zinc finger domain-containing protein [Acidobacteria bacterium]|nr:CGNR zinc finger domain-containing protein [Acidobacteriota bacterium]
MELQPDKFKLIAGDLSLDLVNTASKWQRAENSFSPTGDSLADISDLVSWAIKAKAVDEGTARRVLKSAENDKLDARVLRRVKKLRSAIYGIAIAMITGKAPFPDDVDCLEKARSRALDGQKIEYVRGRLELRRRKEEAPLDAVLDSIALSAVDLFTSDRAERIRVCGGESCGWLFVDDSRGRNRHWCDMRDCGNLAKVRRFRRKSSKV